MATCCNQSAELNPSNKTRNIKNRFNYFQTSYNADFTKKKINDRYGFGKVNAFIGGDMINPKLSIKRDEINANYIRKNQAVLSKAKTGITTYQYDFCGLRPKKAPRGRSLDPTYY